VRDLFDEQRRLAASHDPAERLKTLWIGVLLREHLAKCSDREIGTLLCAVQDSLGVFSAEFLVCEHAKRRFLKSSRRTPKMEWRVIWDAGRGESLPVAAGISEHSGIERNNADP
jgi:hypothetical protein